MIYVFMIISDQSLRDSDCDPCIRHRRGTLQDMLEAAAEEFPKALNGLAFPGAGENVMQTPFATDQVAFANTCGRPFCADEYPMTTLRWGLCATGGAWHYEHEDCEGGGTWLQIDCGVKIWIVGVPLDSRTWDDFADLDLFLRSKDEERSEKQKKFQWVVLVLRAGDTL